MSQKISTSSLRLPISAPSLRERKQVAFDEDEIAEQDKERGTRMKIDEPDTPYMRSPILSDDESHVSISPANRDQMRFDQNDIVQHESHGTSETLKHQEFFAKRKAFYREFGAVREGRLNQTGSSSESES